MPATTDKDPNIITLTNVRLSFPHLFTAHEMPDSTQGPKFSATFLLDNEQHTKLIQEIESKTERVALDFFKKKVILKHRPLRDGNEKSDMEGYGDGTHFLAASSKTRPCVVNRQLTPLTAEDGVLYAGCYVNATIRLFAYDHKTGGKGVSAGLRAVQFVRDGESFGAGPVDAQKEFAELPEDDKTDLSDY